MAIENGFHYRKRGSASYIVHDVRLVRERERGREREREREREGERERDRQTDRQTATDGSVVTLAALKLPMIFARFLAKKLHLSFSPPKWR